MLTTRILCFAAILLVSPLSASAAILLSFSGGNIEPGQYGHLDVLATGSGDLVAAVNFEFLITPIGPTVGSLRFTNPQLSTEVGELNYIFASDSGFFTAAPQNGPAFDSLVGGDSSATFTDHPIDSTPLLIARLDLEHVLPGATDPSLAVGDQFSITLQNNPNTFFVDSSFNDSTVDSASFDPVTITVAAAATSTVPEPTSAFLFGGLGIACLLRRSGFTTGRRKTVGDSESERSKLA